MVNTPYYSGDSGLEIRPTGRLPSEFSWFSSAPVVIILSNRPRPFLPRDFRYIRRDIALAVEGEQINLITTCNHDNARVGYVLVRLGILAGVSGTWTRKTDICIEEVTTCGPQQIPSAPQQQQPPHTLHLFPSNRRPVTRQPRRCGSAIRGHSSSGRSPL